MKTRRVLKKRVKETLIFIFAISVIVSLMLINNNLASAFIDNCESKGYSHNYCVSHS